MDEQKTDINTGADTKKGGFNMKYLYIGLPLFIVQLVAVYFITATVLVPKMNTPQPNNPVNTEHKEEAKDENQPSSHSSGEIGKYIHSFEDVIINPAGTNGQKLMLASVSFDVENEKSQKILQEKEMVVKDVIINTLSCKTLMELSQVGYKDTLKLELAKNLMTKLTDVKVQNVYFTKYIIQ